MVRPETSKQMLFAPGTGSVRSQTPRHFRLARCWVVGSAWHEHVNPTQETLCFRPWGCGVDVQGQGRVLFVETSGDRIGLKTMNSQNSDGDSSLLPVTETWHQTMQCTLSVTECYEMRRGFIAIK